MNKIQSTNKILARRLKVATCGIVDIRTLLVPFDTSPRMGVSSNVLLRGKQSIIAVFSWAHSVSREGFEEIATPLFFV